MPGPHQINAVVRNHARVAQSIDIQGSSFGAAQGASTVRFAPNEVATVLFWSNVLITVSVPGTAVTGPLRVVVGGQEALSPRRADFFHLEVQPFPVGAIDDLEFQNTKNDSAVPGDDLALADARDFNAAVEIAINAQRKIGYNGDPNPDTLDFRLLGPQRIIVDRFGPTPASAVPPPKPPALPFNPPTLLHTFISFPAASDSEALFQFTVPRQVRAGSSLAIIPKFRLSTLPGAPDVVTIDIFGDIEGVAIPPTGGFPYPVGAFPTGTFILGPPIAVIPVDGAPPFAPPDVKVALRLQRLAAGDTYGGLFLLDSVSVGWVR